MTRLPILLTLALCLVGLPGSLWAQAQPEWEIEALTDEGGVVYDFVTGLALANKGVLVKYGGAVLTAETVTVNQTVGEVIADGRVRIQQGDQIWASEHIRYNFKTHQMEAEQFRTGKPPVFAAGQALEGDRAIGVYTATNSFITADDVSNPAIKVRAKSLKIIPGERVEARHAVLYLGGVPVFYFPYYSRSLKGRTSAFNFIPGYRSRFGPYLLGTYTWLLDEQLDGVVHLDYRQRRGPGVGPDVNVNLGRWGQGTFKYYYTHDEDPNIGDNSSNIPENRQRLYFGYQANPATNLNVKAMVRYQSDIFAVRDFIEGEYRDNPQPSTFLEVNKFWQNFSLDTYVQPRVNDFLETIERLPEVRLTGFRQQLGGSPVFYESQSSLGYYRRLFAETNGPNAGPLGLNYSAARADSYHQLLLPHTFLGWLNFTPRIGGRFSYYSQASGPGAVTDEIYRGVFNTGAEVSFKASRVFPSVENKFLEVDGLRHIIEPSLNYVYVPTPNYHGPGELPQFDTELPSLRLLPIDFPGYNAIDAIDSENSFRFGLRNKLQTKRAGQVTDLADWNLYTDWRLQPRSGQTTFADVYSDMVARPFSWATFESLTRYDIRNEDWRMAFHTLTLQPNDVWNWTLGHFYLRDDVTQPLTGLGLGNNLIMSSLFFRLNENWGLRATQHFEARSGRMEEQFYTIYRDLRSWTAALTFRLRDSPTSSEDFTVAFTFSLKAYPRYGLGSDKARPLSLLGGG
jgi:LPS-assembly protein